jgi:hypothetical protein
MTDTGIAVPGLGRLAGLQRYALAVFAPASTSAAHLVVQLLLLATLTPAEFGAFAFLMIVVQFGFGLSNALVSTPYTVEVSSHAQPRQDMRAMFLAANAVFALGCASISSAPWLEMAAGSRCSRSMPCSP